MALFDKIKPVSSTDSHNCSYSGKCETIIFKELPENIEQFKSLSQSSLSTPFDTAALTVLALCYYPENRNLCFDMIDFLRGPRPMNGMDKQFISDRFRDKDYVPRSYLRGAVPENNYLPEKPYAVSVYENKYSYDEQGYAKLYIASGGADSPRSVQLRLAKDGRWYLWEQYLLSGIRQPECNNPWA